MARKLTALLMFVGMLSVALAGTAFAKAKADKPAKAWAVGDKLEVEWNGTWYKSEILEAKDGKFKITYIGWDHKWDEWVTEKRMRPMAPGWKVGDKLEVEWKGKWYKSEILEAKDGKFKITYVGWDHKWDEWVTEKRMRPAKK